MEQMNNSALSGAAQTAPDPLSELFDLLEEEFYNPDTQAIRIVLGTMQAHYLDIGDPAWLFVIAPPGCGKTTMSIMTAGNLPSVKALGDITESTFISGWQGEPGSPCKTPGLLEQLGETIKEGQTSITTGNGLFILKDFTTVLSMRREKRSAILSQLREIHDGEFSRAFGTGVRKIWRGRIGIVAAVTPAIDRHYAVFNVLGERFLQVRWDRPDSEEAGVRAIAQQGRENGIREKTRQIVGELFRNALGTPPEMTPTMIRRIAAVAEIVAKGRTYIYRNGLKRDIDYVPQSEANTRIAKGLAGIARGIASLRGESTVGESEFQDVVRVAFDSLPENRRKVMKAILDDTVCELRLPRTVLDREREDLYELGLVESGGYEFSKSVKRLLNVAQIGAQRK